MTASTTLAALLFTTTTATLLAQQPQWQALNPPSWPTGGGSGIAYDHLRDRVAYLSTGGVYYEFDGQAWTAVSGPTPGGRYETPLTYDTARSQFVLFGGELVGGTGANDTWLYDGTGWTQASPVTVPPVRHTHAMAYDEARQRVVMFGGRTGSAGHYGDTWEWDGQNWLQRQPGTSPSPRSFTAATYDSRRSRILLFGGLDNAVAYFETWRWNGSDWQLLPTSSAPQMLGNLSMTYDRERDRAILVGPHQQSFIPQLWEFDGAAWQQGPSPASVRLEATYDRQRGRVVGFAMYHYPRTWQYSVPGLAVAQPYGVGCGMPPMQANADPNARPLLGNTLAVDIDGVPNGIAFMSFGWSNTQVLGLSLPLAMAGFGLPGCWLLQSDDAIALPCTMTGPTTARFTFPIPSHPSFLGLRFFLQPWGPSPGANPGGAIVGDAIAVTLGSY